MQRSWLSAAVRCVGRSSVSGQAARIRRLPRPASRSRTSRAPPASTRASSSAAQATNKYLLETTGTGVALFDYDSDGWLDIFFVNGIDARGLSAKGRSRPTISIATRATARSRT